MTAPRVSVIMSVYNGAADAPAAINSILKQTFKDFEFIIIDNGSQRDDTARVLAEIVAKAGDPRLRLVTLTQNVGLAGALNHGISLARGKYIARQDHDDLSRPQRLAAQVAFMEANPACALLGTRAEIWRGNTPRGISHNHATTNAELQFDLMFNNPFVHSSVLIRKSALDETGAYTLDPVRQPPEDYELWSRLSRRHEIGNLAENHLIYREVPQSMSRDADNPFLARLITISAENIAFNAGRAPDDASCRNAARLIHCAYDQLDADADIEDICAAVVTAAENLMRRLPGNDLKKRAEKYCADLRHHFTYRGAPQKTDIVTSTLRRMPLPDRVKTFGRAMLSLTRRA